jgi:hypothetical protein
MTPVFPLLLFYLGCVFWRADKTGVVESRKQVLIQHLAAIFYSALAKEKRNQK